MLIVLLAGIAVCVRTLAVGHETAWTPSLSKSTARFLLRSLTMTMGLGAWFVSQSLVGARECRNGAIGDAVHEWTSPLHGWLLRHPRAANAQLIASSGFIDLFGLFLLGAALVGPTLRPWIGLLLLFGFRQLSQLTCALPPPPAMIWRHPGFPSLLVTYHVANDFFFSGHTAIAVLGAIEIAKTAPPWMAVVGALTVGFEAATVLVLRSHYTMDVLTAIVAAFCAAGLAATLTAGF